MTLVDYLKDFFKVARPADALVVLTDYAFPSGHSAFAFVVATFGIYTIYSKSKTVKNPRNIWRRNKIIKNLSYVLLVIAALLVGYQRLHIGVHTLFQVFAGAILGIFVTLVMIRFVNLLFKK